MYKFIDTRLDVVGRECGIVRAQIEDIITISFEGASNALRITVVDSEFNDVAIIWVGKGRKIHVDKVCIGVLHSDCHARSQEIFASGSDKDI